MYRQIEWGDFSHQTGFILYDERGNCTMNNEKTLLLQLSHHILYSYFEKNDLEPLLSSLAEDVVWIGTGKHMCRIQCLCRGKRTARALRYSI